MHRDIGVDRFKGGPEEALAGEPDAEESQIIASQLAIVPPA